MILRNSSGSMTDDLLPEELSVTQQLDEHYLWVDWFSVDPNPDEAYFETEYGPCPKQVMLFNNQQYVRTDFSVISLS